jgi:hypothetical protein
MRDESDARKLSPMITRGREVNHSSESGNQNSQNGVLNIEAALQPLNDQQRQVNERLAKLQHTLDVMNYQQRERDSNSNINRDMVMLVVLVVMIQVIN